MAGQFTTGVTMNNSGAGHLNMGRAYDEGVFHRAQGTEIAYPQSDNPHPVGSEDHNAWDAGWAAADAVATVSPGTSMTRAQLGSCADPGPIVSSS